MTPLVKCPMTCRKVSWSVWLTSAFFPPRWLGDSSHPGDPEPAGRYAGRRCRSASHRQTRIWQLAFLRGYRKVTLLMLPRVPAGDKRWFPPAEYGWEEGGPAEPAHETRLPPPRRTGPQGSVRCRFPAGGHVVLERAMHERVRSRRMDRRPVEVADTRIRASVRDGDVELADKLLGRSFEIAAGRRHRPTRGVQPGRPLLLSRRTAVLSS